MAAACRGQGVHKPVSTYQFQLFRSQFLPRLCLRHFRTLRRDAEPVCTDSANKNPFLHQHPTPNSFYREFSTAREDPSYKKENSTALTQSMLQITTTKLTALSQQQQRYETKKYLILKGTASKSQLWEKVKALLDGYEEYNVPVPRSISAGNVRRFLEQSRHDQSVSPSLLREWQIILEQALDTPSRKHEHASLFGELVMEWLGKTRESPTSSLPGEDTDPSEHTGRKEMYDQRKEWESIVFADDSKPDPTAIEAYLTSMFYSSSQAKKLTRSPLDRLRGQMQSFVLGTFDINILKTCIAAVLKAGSLSYTKRKTLSEFLGNSAILREMVDVLNMHIDDLDSWSWGDEAVSVDLRRALNGKYRVYMDEEMLQALLLHFVGIQWAVHLRTAFYGFFNSEAWKQSPRNSMDARARQTRQFYLDGRQNSWIVRSERHERYKREYFLLQLPASFNVSTGDKYNDTSYKAHDKSKSPMATKQSLLHLISTEALIHTRLYGSFTILKSDFRWFGPSLPHAAILTVLRFFGVPDRWLNFFEKFLGAPIKFAMDGRDAQTRTRQCGVPIQHQLSDAMSEAVLFCMDFAVNRSTESNLYRLHDDIWFWGDKDATIKAWKAIQDFASAMGLHLNDEKTGAVELSGDPVTAHEFGPSDELPSGPITWGFLKMGTSGKWAIDDAQVDTHIEELKVQLEACKSIFSWVQAWNVYVARFISNNFGEPAICMGRPHIDMVMEAFKRIQSRLFAADGLTGVSALGHLKAKLNARFGIEDAPDGFFYFPTKLGGLGLLNPLIPLFNVYEQSLKDPKTPVQVAIEAEEARYERVKKDWDDGTLFPQHHGRSDEPFMSLKEYTQYLEETSADLYQAYKRLMEVPSKTAIRFTPDVANAVLALPSILKKGWGSNEEWVVQLYGPEIIRRYGGLAMGDQQLLPIGLVDMLRKEKIRWLG